MSSEPRAVGEKYLVESFCILDDFQKPSRVEIGTCLRVFFYHPTHNGQNISLVCYQNHLLIFEGQQELRVPVPNSINREGINQVKPNKHFRRPCPPVNMETTNYSSNLI